MWACQRAKCNKGQCTFSICQSCYEKRQEDSHSTSDRRGASRRGQQQLKAEYNGSETPQTEKAKKCHHATSCLETYIGQLHWTCKPSEIGKQKWFDSIAGCSDCKKMYLVVRKKQNKPPKDWSFPNDENMDEAVAQAYKQWRSGAFGRKLDV